MAKANAKKNTRSRLGRPPRPDKPGAQAAVEIPLKAALLEEADTLVMHLNAYIAAVLRALEPRERLNLASQGERHATPQPQSPAMDAVTDYAPPC